MVALALPECEQLMSENRPSPLSDEELKEHLKQYGRQLGFSLIGVAAAARPETFAHFQHWLSEGLHGEMEYMSRRERAYEHPSGVQVGVRAIVMAAMHYGQGTQRPSGAGQVAAYAQGTADYHNVLRQPLQKLAEELHRHRPGVRTRMAIDTAPLLERDLAQRAGIGWFGKNTMLINKQAGSYFFLTALLTDLALPPDEPHRTSHCGTCTRCLQACPTDAFVGPYVLDASRCISYLTIELRDQPVPEELRRGMGDWLFGCDVCQQVCPWNRKSHSPGLPDFAPIPEQLPAPEELLPLSEADFSHRFGNTPFTRPGRVGMGRNAAIVMGNTRDPAHLPTLDRSLSDESPLIRGAAAWAMGEIGSEQARHALASRLEMETDPEVKEEIIRSLEHLQASES